MKVKKIESDKETHEMSPAVAAMQLFDKGNAMLLEINTENPQQRLIDQVVNELRAGAVIACPTGTGYGLSCDLFHARAIKKLMLLKKRPKHKPFSIICHDLSDIAHFAHVSNTAYRLLKRNLPGPYTLVLPGTKLLPKIMVTKQKTVGIRVADQPISAMLTETLGNPLVNTSVQLTKEEDPLAEAWQIEEHLGNQITLVIDGGTIYPEPSSVIDLTTDTPIIIREGKGDLTPFR